MARCGINGTGPVAGAGDNLKDEFRGMADSVNCKAVNRKAGDTKAQAKPGEVYFFGTCLVDTIYPQAGLAAVELMEREGLRVIYPPGQTCCGQPPFNSGYRNEARQVAASQIALFPKPIPVVVPSGSCSAMMCEHYGSLFPEDSGEDAASDSAAGGGEGDGAGDSMEDATIARRAREFSRRVVEWSDFMVNVLDVKLKDLGPPVKVTYHPSCHLLRDMGVRDAPLHLLRQLEQVDFRPLPEAEECCGFGGTFAIKQGDISWAMVEDKRRTVEESGAEVLVSLDCGCLMHIAGAMAKAGQPIQAMPLAQFLKERTSGEGGS